MKFNWGHGILLGLLAFMTFIIVLVSKMIGAKVDLVSPDYYEKGIAYQEQIDNDKLSNSDVFVLKQIGIDLLLQPKDTLNVLVNKPVQLDFFRPSDKDLDFSLQAKVDSFGKLQLSQNQLTKGLWRIKVSWMENGKTFFTEKDLVWQ
jgi:hypothetical protein